MTCSHRERVLAALNHEQPDRVPIDLGGCFSTGLFFTAYAPLMEHLGLPYQQRTLPLPRRTAVLDPVLLERFDIDTRFAGLGAYEGNQRVIDEDTFLDEWGVTWRKVGDGPYMDEGGPFSNRPAKMADLEDCAWPDADNPGYYCNLVDQVAALRKTDRAIILNLRYGIIHQGMFLRGFAQWLKDLYKNTDYACRMMDILADYWTRLAENALAAAGDDVDVVYIGDDLAMQQGPLFSPDTYRELVKPRHRRMLAPIKERGIKVVYHSCGSVMPLINDLIDIGVDAINPVQVSAKGMDIVRLKEEFGDRISFWGGIDTHNTLPFGTPDEVRDEVRRTISILGRGGGYVLNSVHNLQPDVPPENIVAMFDEARTFVPD